MDLSTADERVSYALIALRDAKGPTFGGAATAIVRTGLVVRCPLVYRDGCIHGHIVGDSATLQPTLDTLLEAIRVQIDAMRQFPNADVNPATTLSDRQQEALQTALEMGDYDAPRGATHADVAEELGCAPNTASERRQQGEANLVDAGRTGCTPSL